MNIQLHESLVHHRSGTHQCFVKLLISRSTERGIGLSYEVIPSLRAALRPTSDFCGHRFGIYSRGGHAVLCLSILPPLNLSQSFCHCGMIRWHSRALREYGVALWDVGRNLALALPPPD